MKTNITSGSPLVQEESAGGSLVTQGRKPCRRNFPAFSSKPKKGSLGQINPHHESANKLLEDCNREHASNRNTNKDSERERLKRLREEVGGRISIPEKWGKEELLGDWMDYSSFDALLAPKGITSAREALMAEARRAGASSHQRLRIESVS